MSNIQTQSWLIDRRHALRAMGTCIALPMLECMIPLNAKEKTNSPRRSAFIYLANGVHSINYQITKPGKDYEFSRSLKPLEKFRNTITPISGLHHPGSLGHHHNCINVFLTGGKIGAAHRNTISVDQKMARVSGQHTRYSSMEIALTQGSLAWTGGRCSTACHAQVQSDLRFPLRGTQGGHRRPAKIAPPQGQCAR